MGLTKAGALMMREVGAPRGGPGLAGTAGALARWGMHSERRVSLSGGMHARNPGRLSSMIQRL